MAKSQESFAKREKEKRRKKKQKEKRERRAQRKLEKEESGPKSFDDMISYVDEDGNLTSTPPDPTVKKKIIKAEDIQLGAAPMEKITSQSKRSGRLKFFNTEKGFGFIEQEGSRDSIFVHMNSFEDPIKEGDPVTYEVERGVKGLNAVRVKLAK